METSQEDELRARIRDLEAALHQNDHQLALAYDLTPKLSDLLGLLLAVPVANSETIRQRLEITTDTKVSIHRLRQHMKQFGVDIHSRRGFGYWLDDATKESIKAKITQEVTTNEADATNVVPFAAHVPAQDLPDVGEAA